MSIDTLAIDLIFVRGKDIYAIFIIVSIFDPDGAFQPQPGSM